MLRIGIACIALCLSSPAWAQDDDELRTTPPPEPSVPSPTPGEATRPEPEPKTQAAPGQRTPQGASAQPAPSSPQQARQQEAAKSEQPPAQQPERPEEGQAAQQPEGAQEGAVSTGPRLPPPAEQPPPVWQADPELVTRASQASEQVAQARLQLARFAPERAEQALDQAAASLALLLESAPGAALADEIAVQAALLGGTDQPVDLAPLAEAMKEWRAVLQPEIPTAIRAAERQLAAGNRRAASLTLLEAHAQLAEDLALRPAAEAYAQVRTAQLEIADGNMERARRMLWLTPEALDRLAVGLPLVPVRLQLRAAATAADEGQWAQVERHLNEASAGLRELQARARPEVAAQARVLNGRAQYLQSLVTSSRQPSPQTFRRLASETRLSPAG